jgi:hypothetical protein
MKNIAYKLIVFDWKEIPDIKEIQRAVKSGHINLYEGDTGGDDYCWILSKTPLTKKEVNNIIKKEFYEE